MYHAACKVEFSTLQSVVLTAEVFQFCRSIFLKRREKKAYRLYSCPSRGNPGTVPGIIWHLCGNRTHCCCYCCWTRAGLRGLPGATDTTRTPTPRVVLVVSLCLFLFFLNPIYYLRPFVLSLLIVTRPSVLSLLIVTQIRGHVAGSSPPVPTTVRALHFYRDKISALSSLVDSRRIMSTSEESLQEGGKQWQRLWVRIWRVLYGHECCFFYLVLPYDVSQILKVRCITEKKLT